MLHEWGIDVSHETVRFRWHRFRPIFATAILRRRVGGLVGGTWLEAGPGGAGSCAQMTKRALFLARPDRGVDFSLSA